MQEARLEYEPPEETGVLASRWFWRLVWLFIFGLMGLLFTYEFVWLE
jgi:hypothetical protein